MILKELRIRLIKLLVLSTLLCAACQATNAAPLIPTSTQLSIVQSTETPKENLITKVESTKSSPATPSARKNNLLPESETEKLAGIEYVSQSGDTVTTIAARFDVTVEDITSTYPIPETDLISPGRVVFIDTKVKLEGKSGWLLPDSEIVYGPSAKGFEINKYLQATYGNLKDYQEWLASTGWTSSGDIIQRVALENSINPRLLLTLLEWECQCVLGNSTNRLQEGYVFGVEDYHRKGLYGQMSWAARVLAEGYYGWRTGQLTAISSDNDILSPLMPDMNAGTVALNEFLSQLIDARVKTAHPLDAEAVRQALLPQTGLAALHTQMFGDPWEREQQFGPIFPENVSQPNLILPFETGKKWSFISGPHPAWENAGTFSALDFAPASNQPGCVESSAWVVAVADGTVVRSNFGVVSQDLDDPQGSPAPANDGYEGSGWSILYLHISEENRVPVGTYLRAGDPIGHPSCEGGPATGTHLHIARKFNGEWIAADGPLPFILGDWTAHVGEKAYEGTLTNGEYSIPSNLYGTKTSVILRPSEGDSYP